MLKLLSTVILHINLHIKINSNNIRYISRNVSKNLLKFVLHI